MKNEFVTFIQSYTFPDHIIHALDDFIGNSGGMIKTNTGGSSTLATNIHEKMQKAVADTIRFHEITGVAHERQAQEEDVVKQLAWDIEKDIRSNSVIDGQANFNSRNVAEYFMDKHYKKLLYQAKLFAQNFDQLNSIYFQNDIKPDQPNP